MSHETEHPSAETTAMVSRRDFLRASSLGAATTVGASMACRRASSDAPMAVPRFVDEEFFLAEATIATLREGLDSGAWTARSILEQYLTRIDRLNRSGPALHAVLETNPDAFAIADRLDREWRDRGPRGPLHGIPILLKDNIDTGDRMTTTAGSLALSGWAPSMDSEVASRLRGAGAVLVGKANLSEWANFRSTRSSSGWSARGGQCRNPYVLDRNPCGSSSGSGVGVSANLTALAIGTETDGSIVCPSSANGVVGIKPTVGLVSRAGIIPISHTQDTVGPMTRTVRDAAIVLGVIAGSDSRDPASEASEVHGLTNYTQFLDPDGLRGMRLGVARQFLGFHEQVDRVFESAVAAMRSAGAVIVDPVGLGSVGRRAVPENLMTLGTAETEVLLYEFKAGLNAYLARRNTDAAVRSLADLIAFNHRHATDEMPYFGQERLLAAEAKGPLSEPAYLVALAAARRLSQLEGIDRTMNGHQLDAIIAPTGGPAWVTDLVNGDHFGGSSSGYPAVAGYPNITVPAGEVHELPIGLSFFGRAWSEPTLIRIAYSFEQLTQARRVPRFLPTLT
ncbi:MAG: amidase [Acidobacteriota bacterium]|nr:amidase [Acidobacteriota bacterium]